MALEQEHGGVRDPIRLEVIRHAFLSITEEMSAALQRAAYSTNIKTRADYSCAIFDPQLRLVAQSFAQPTHLGALIHIVPRAVQEYGVDQIGEGDAIMMNDPHRGATHLNDIVVIAPAYERGILLGYVANLAHHVDVGGGAPGSIATGSEIFQEGLIIPPVKLLDRGRINRDVFALVGANIRSPKESGGDFRAQIAANNLGIRRLAELVGRYGRETLFDTVEELFAYTERRSREAIAELPAGTYTAEDFMDDDGVSDVPVRIVVTVRIGDGRIAFDLTGTDAQRPGPVNCTSSMTFSAVAFVVKCLIDHDIPANDGFYRLLSLNAPAGTVANARHPAPIAGGWEVCFRICETTFRALADALPGQVIAATKGIICNVAFGGTDPRTGNLYAFYETIAGGFGARPTKDGMDGVQPHVHNTENAPVEETEVTYPVRIVRLALIPDSEGAGRFRGGLGVRRDYQFPDSPAVFSILSDRAKFAPWGLFGGLPARTAHYVLDPDGEARALRSKTTVKLQPGQTISIQTPGGGGYGPPIERDPDLVAADVRAGKVSIERARAVYRVAIDPTTGTVDRRATAALRGEAAR